MTNVNTGGSTQETIEKLEAKVEQYEKVLKAIGKGNYPRHDIEWFGDEADRFARTELKRIRDE